MIITQARGVPNYETGWGVKEVCPECVPTCCRSSSPFLYRCAACEKNVCTFNFTKRSFFVQRVYRCVTCNLTGNDGVCLPCARLCHVGHRCVCWGWGCCCWDSC